MYLFTGQVEWGFNSSNERLVVLTTNDATKPCTRSGWFNGKEAGYVSTKLGLQSFPMPKESLEFIKDQSWLMVITSPGKWGGAIETQIGSDGKVISNQWVPYV